MESVKTMNFFIFMLCCIFLQVQSERTFTIDLDKNTFLKDGEPFNYVSGSVHYMRIPHEYWRDRLMKAYAAGLDAIQVYVNWNVHEPSPGVYDFRGQEDLAAFIKQADDIGLLVILRAGPYICGEWEYGGLPPWILAKNGSVVVRSMDPGYIVPVDTWLDVLLPKIKPLLYINGGNVIMVQVENEYGSYFACDRVYTAHLRDTFRRHLGDEVVLFTTDGAGMNFLKCGAIPNVYATVDFGPGNVTNGFNPMRQWNPKGPLVNSEFYTGWLDYWGDKHAHSDTNNIIKSLKDILDINASVSMYMFEGGTNFGYMNGADPPFNICPTSYDYDAPLTEAGDITPKYMAIRDLLNKYGRVPNVPVPPSTPKYAYGKVSLQKVGRVTELLSQITEKSVNSTLPLSMEEIGQNYGFIMYSTSLPKCCGSLSVSGIRDQGHVLVNGDRVGLVDRKGSQTVQIQAQVSDRLEIIVENQGRINFGQAIVGNRKGIISNVTLDGAVLTDWTMHSLNFTRLFEYKNSGDTSLRWSSFGQTGSASVVPPSVYKGDFTLPPSLKIPQDTFLNPTGWNKGQAFVNGYNLGRYWPGRGPQVTLYVPGPYLRPYPEINTVMLAETSAVPGDTIVMLQDTAVIDGPVS